MRASHSKPSKTIRVAKAVLDKGNSIKFDPSPKAPDILERFGYFFINMDRPGFNSKTNNGMGYSSAQKAQDVIDGKRSRFA